MLILQEQGYYFDVGETQKKYFGTVAVISADNPASNGLGGFKESTAATHYCRQCMADGIEALSEVSIIISDCPQYHFLVAQV